jgi:hypothetical protein
MPEPIFVSYRREDSSDAAGRLKETIRHRFGEDFVFMDTSAIKPGDKWPASLQAALEASRVVLAVIGPGWLKASDDWGLRRIDKPDDWVRKELDFALVRFQRARGTQQLLGSRPGDARWSAQALYVEPGVSAGSRWSLSDPAC